MSSRDPEILSAVRAPTVCLVEDHQLLRNAMADRISGEGYRVVAAVGSVEAGLDAILMLRPEIAVIDNQLPDGRGVDLCQTLSSLAPEVTLILHSGAVSDDLAAEARRAGAGAVVTKSIRGTELLSSIASFAHRAAGASGGTDVAPGDRR